MIQSSDGDNDEIEVIRLSNSRLDVILKTNFQIPGNPANLILTIFESLGMYSSEYGLLDYLRGHFPPRVRDSLEITFPAQPAATSDEKDTAATPLKESISLVLSGDSNGFFQKVLPDDDEDGAARRAHASVTKHLAATSSKEHSLGLLFLLRAADALKGSIEVRARVVKLRLRCLSVLITSRTPHIVERMNIHLKSGSQLVRDLLSLSDLSSEPLLGLGLKSPLSISALALDCTVNVIKCTVKRRGSICVDRALGLVRAGESREDMEMVGGSHETPWVSMVLAACAAASAEALNSTDTDASSESKRSSEPVTPSDSAVAAAKYAGSCDLMGWEEEVTSTLYMRIALELFACCLNVHDGPVMGEIRDSDSAIVSAIVGFLQSSMGNLSSVLQLLDADVDAASAPKTEAVDGSVAVAFSVDPKHKQIMWSVSKAFACLDYCFEVTRYHSSIMDCNVLSPVASVLELFTTHEAISKPYAGAAVKSVVENSLSVLSRCLIQSRGIPSPNNPGEAAMQIVRLPFFALLSRQVFSSLESDMEYLWLYMLNVTRNAIQAEPAYLAQFLRTPQAQQLKDMIRNYGDSPSSERGKVKGIVSPTDVDEDMIILPLAQLMGSMCITVDGQTFVAESRMVPFLLAAITSERNLLPNSAGISRESIEKCGRAIAGLIRERDRTALREDIHKRLKMSLDSICTAARNIQKSLRFDEDPTFDTPRMQVLQKLANLCVLLENLRDDRRSVNDCLRDLVNEEMVSWIVSAFPCTLPPARQLLAQLSVRPTAEYAAPYFGHFSCAKAITSFLRTATTLRPDMVMPVLFRAIDEALADISANKQDLIARSPLSDSKGNESKGGDTVGLPTDESGAGSLGDSATWGISRRPSYKKRSSSFGKSGGNVHIGGILDFIPHVCMFDDWVEENMTTLFTASLWRFLSSTLTLEWLGSMLSNNLRSLHRSHGSGLLSAGKDVIRRLFAFHRSGTLEVCRFATSKWDAKVRHVFHHSPPASFL